MVFIKVMVLLEAVFVEDPLSGLVFDINASDRFLAVPTRTD